MKIVKLFGFLLLLTSCNQYLGTIEPDYIPQNEVEEVFLNKTRALESDDEFKIGEVFYPDDKKFDLKEILDFKKIASIDKNSQFLISENKIYVLGIDKSKKMIQKAKKYESKYLRFLENDFVDIKTKKKFS